MGPRAIKGVANLTPYTKLGQLQQDANRFVKGSPIASQRMDGLMNRRQRGNPNPPPLTNRHLVY